MFCKKARLLAREIERDVQLESLGFLLLAPFRGEHVASPIRVVTPDIRFMKASLPIHRRVLASRLGLRPVGVGFTFHTLIIKFNQCDPTGLLSTP
jgi:hypothetical protein